MFEKPKLNKKEIPTGTGRESEPKETLPAVEVQNEVIWVNPDFPELPFDIKEGEPTKLGLFLTPRPKEGEKNFDLKVAAEHRRSALLGRVIFKDKQGWFYRDIDLKGAGYSHITEDSIKVGRIQPHYLGDSNQACGILNLNWAKYARDMSEKFLKAGIRTERYIALIKLKEIVDNHGYKISIGKAKKGGYPGEYPLLPKSLQPAIALRAFATKFRIRDIDMLSPDSIEKLEDARKIVSQELGVNEKDFSFQKYFEWFAKTLGENIGLMHKNGWFHRYLNEHNVTLDCRIVDLDSVGKFANLKEWVKKNKRMEEDIRSGRRNVLYTLEHVFDALKIKRGDYTKIFFKAYEEALGYTPKFLKERA